MCSGDDLSHPGHRRSQDFQRVGALRGGSRISGWGDDGGAEGPE